MTGLASLFRARSVVIIGASDKNPWTGLVVRSLKAVGFPGQIHLVNRRGTAALGQNTVSSCAELKNVDAAFITVPAVGLQDAIEDMATAAIRFGVVVTSGFAETGIKGATEQTRIFARAHELGVTLLGPNSLGFTNFVDRISLGAIPLKSPQLLRPRVGLVSQSGATAAMVYQFAHQQGVSLSYSIAMGNEAMIDIADVIEYLVGDESTRAIAVFAETIRKPKEFERAARAAAATRKPIVVLKVGTGALSATVAQAHTGALVGDDRIFQAICDDYNIVRVDSIEDLVITSDVLAEIGAVDAAKGFALVSISGGACEIVADRGEEVGIPFPQFLPQTLERLSQVLPDFGAAHNPLDVTGAALRNPEIYTGSIAAVGQDPNIGLIGIVSEVPASAEAASPMSAGALTAIAAGLASVSVPGLLIQQIMKPVTSFGLELLVKHSLPAAIGGLDHAVRALGHLFAWSRKVGHKVPSKSQQSTGGADRPQTEPETLHYLKNAGVPVIPQTLVTTRSDAVNAARSLGGAVVLKILSPDIPHKTEVGGVALDLSGDIAVGEAFDAMLSRVALAKPQARIQGIVVSPMRRGGLELLVGIARDPKWGLVMAVALGGIWVEILNDSCLKVLPVSSTDARDMLDRLKASQLLKGYRGSRPADLDKLAQVIEMISNAALTMGSELAALEINPLRVHGSDIEALDALAIWQTASP